MARPPADAPLLSAEKITARAVELLDREGLEALSIRRLAADLNVNPKSLYHYFSNKEELLQGVYVHILQELELPDLPAADWPERFAGLAHSLRLVMLRHAGFVGYYLHRHRVSAEELDIYESLYRLLRDIGLPEDLIAEYGSVLIIFLVGFCYAELNGNFSHEVFTQRKALAKSQPERFPVALNLPMPQEGYAPDAFFKTALDIMLAGLRSQHSKELDFEAEQGAEHTSSDTFYR